MNLRLVVDLKKAEGEPRRIGFELINRLEQESE